MFNGTSNIKLFSGSSSKALATKIATELGVQVGNMSVGKFSDGEISVNICETVRGCDVYIVQSTSYPVNDNLMELLVIIDAMKRASAGRITAVIPYFGYARQDRKARARDPITSKLCADLITTAGADRVLTMDLHAAQIQGFFNIPVDHLLGMPVIAKTLLKRKYKPEELTIVSPDVGSVSRARKIAEKFNAPLAIIDKRRPKANVMEVMNIIGNVEGKTCIMIDDMIDTAGTIVQGAEALVKNGAKEVIACCTHSVFSGPAIERLSNSCIKELLALDTIELPQEKIFDKLTIASVAPIFAEAIKRIHDEVSVSKLFDID